MRMSIQEIIGTVLVLLGGYQLYRISRSSPFVQEIGDSNVEFRPEAVNSETSNAEASNSEASNAEAANLEADEGYAFDHDERARAALEERQQQQIQEMREEPRVAAWKQRGTVGTKKAKSLARREQRRAYFEYVRSQAEQERERIRLEEEMFGDLVAEEREEREQRIEQAKNALAEASQARKEEEEAERQRTLKARQKIAADLQNRGVVPLCSDEDVDLATDFANALVLESGEHVVRVTAESVDCLAGLLQKHGEVSQTAIAKALQEVYR